MKTTRVVVVGYGRWGRYCHAPLVRQAPGLELAGVVSSDAGKRAEIETRLGVRAYVSFEEVLVDDSVDAVVLVTPNDTHRDFAVRALAAGKHVVTDKPMCLSLVEFDAMAEAAQASGKVLTVFQNRRLDGDFFTLSGLVAEERLGELRWLEMAWQSFGAGGGWRGTHQHGGGRFFDLGAHMLDQTLLLLPERVTSVYLRLHHDWPKSEVESEAFAVLGFENGATAVCDCSCMAAISKPRFFARGTAGTFRKYGLDPQESALMQGDISTAEEDPATFGLLKGPESEETVPTLAGRWVDYYANFARAAAGEEAPLVTLEQARRLIAVFDAGWQSAREGQVVRCLI